MLELPSNAKDRVDLLDYLGQRALEHQNSRRCRWLITKHWLAGNRNLQVTWATGQVSTSLYNSQSSEGELQMLYEAVVPKVQNEIGRLNRADLRPATTRKGTSLHSLRKASSARVLLEYLTGATNWKQFGIQFWSNLVLYGNVGVTCWVRGEEWAGLGDVEPEGGEQRESSVVLTICPPWEILPIPGDADSYEAVEALLRRRWVPLSWLKRQAGLSIPREVEKLRPRPGTFGVLPSDSVLNIDSSLASSPAALFRPDSGVEKGLGKGTQTDYVLLEEFFFLHEQRDRLARWVVKVGDAILRDTPYPVTKICPLATARYYHIGSFYGRSFAEILIPINAEAEKMARKLFQNIKDLDNFGITLVPSTWGVDKRTLTELRGTRKFEFYEPDLASPDMKPQTIMPITSNEIPGRVLALADQMLDNLAQHSQMLQGQAPGRVDSASALQVLEESSNIPLTVPAASAAAALSQIFAAVLQAAPDLLAGRRDLPLLGLDDNLLGLKIDRDGGRIQLQPDNFPTPAEVEIGIRDELPSSRAIRTQELLDSLTRGVITPLEFKIYNWQENLNYPTGSWAEFESYRKAMLQCLYLFGDGETPGVNVPVNETADMPEVHLIVIRQFMAKPEFTFASVEVRQAFENLLIQYLDVRAGPGAFPGQMPYPEDAAEQAGMMAEQGMMGGGMMGGGGGMVGQGGSPQGGMAMMGQGGGGGMMGGMQ